MFFNIFNLYLIYNADIIKRKKIIYEYKVKKYNNDCCVNITCFIKCLYSL